MKVALVVQRYGLEVNGGSERLARQVAEHLMPYCNVEVLTTCARDYTSWENYYAPGLALINSVPVRRFPVRQPRDEKTLEQLSPFILGHSHQRELLHEMRWMQAQGPDAPSLFWYIRNNHQDYDLFIFFTYLYSTTVFGLPLVGYKSILCPTAHDEVWLRFDLYRGLFTLPRAFIFLSSEERELVHQRFHNQYIAHAVIGGGIEPMRRHGPPPLAEDYILYLGRVDLSKGCGELIKAFQRYRAETNDSLKLVLVGQVVMELPTDANIIATGFVSDEARANWVSYAKVLVMPSQHESFSLATLEGWAAGVPAIVNGLSKVLYGHCVRSGAGLSYASETEFVMALRLLRSQPELREKMGAAGQAYVTQNYSWRMISQQYIEFLRGVYETVYQPSPTIPRATA